MLKTLRHILVPGLACLAVWQAQAADKPYRGPHIENDHLLMVLVPRTPEQMAAFYEARGFPREAVDLIASTCFITVHIHNRSDDVLWLELAEWAFTARGEPLALLDDEWWDAQWNTLALQPASRSTFGWTRLPQVRDLQPDEPVGGNIAFAGDTTAFTLEARFRTGAGRRGDLLSYRFDNIACAHTEPRP